MLPTAASGVTLVERLLTLVAADELGWADHDVDPTAVASVRAGALASYGSCSFDEPTAAMDAVAERLRQRGVDYRGLQPERGRLDEVFRRITAPEATA